MLKQHQPRAAWPFVLGAAAALILGGIGLWTYVIHGMSDPAKPLLVGIRIDGSRISVKAPTCLTDRVAKVEVFDSATEKRLWLARNPKTPVEQQGAVTLWDNEAFTPRPQQERPADLPKNLDVAFEYVGTGDGAGDVFNITEATSASVPAGQYWTYDGPTTAKAIDQQLICTANKP